MRQIKNESFYLVKPRVKNFEIFCFCDSLPHQIVINYGDSQASNNRDFYAFTGGFAAQILPCSR